MMLNATREDIRVSAAFTGYRPHKLPFGNDLGHPDAIRLRENIKTEYIRLIRHGFRQFLTGGALGSDMMAAEVILELRQELRPMVRISHWVCMPCFDYTARWSDADKERLEKIKEKSNAFYVSECPYYNGCMQKRNQYMVDTSRALVSVYDGQSGGTHSTVEYAKRKNKKVIIIDPRQFMRIELVSSPMDAELLLMDDQDAEY